MNNIRLPAKALESLHDAPAEENETFIVIFIIFFGRRTLVDTVAAVIFGIVEEINLNLLLQIIYEGRFDVSEFNRIPDRNRYFVQSYDVVKSKLPFTDKSVSRHHNAYLVSEIFDCFRKGARNICKPASFCERVHFAGHKENIQWSRHIA